MAGRVCAGAGHNTLAVGDPADSRHHLQQQQRQQAQQQRWTVKLFKASAK